MQTSICYLNTWVALLLSLQKQNPNTIFSALTSKRLELITLAKDKIPSYCSFSFRKLIQALALKNHWKFTVQAFKKLLIYYMYDIQ